MTKLCQAVSADATAVAVLACELWPEHSLEEMRSEFTPLLAREDEASSCTESRKKTWTLHSVSFAGMMWREEACTGLWSTPKELLIIVKAFVKAFHGESPFLQKESAREMARPVKDFPWTGLGVFTGGEDVLVSQGWGENGQCMVKMNIRAKNIAVVMTNRNPGIDQAESGVEWLVDGKLNEKE